jgi:epoxyqueuosine reductase
LRGRIARFAWGSDYHEVLLPRLRALAQFVGSCNAKAYTDSGPLLARDIAASAGLGFVGRNTMFIRPRMGSLVLLGELLLDVELEYDAADVGPGNPCGNCRRCLDACPTGAFVDEYVLDASNCISYLTIENKGSIPEGLRRKMGNWIFGCDECQVVCPWVRRYSRPSARPFLSWDPDRCAPELAELLQMDEAAFRRRFAGTPVLRAKRRGLLRNAAVALGNSGDASALPILRRAQEDGEPLVREHAAWAEAAILAAK